MISFIDKDTELAINKWPYKDILFVDGNLVLNPTKAQTTNIKVTVSLVSFPKISKTEVFTATVTKATVVAEIIAN